MWICPNCGQPGDDNDKQCEMCGHVRKRTRSKTAKKATPVKTVKPADPVPSEAKSPDPPTQTQAARTFHFETKSTVPEKVVETPAPEEEAPPPEETPLPEPEIEPDTPEPDSTETIPEYIPEITPEPEERERKPLPERPFITILTRLSKQPRFWIILGSVLLAFMLIPYGVRQVIELSSRNTYDINKNKVESELQEKLDLLIEDTLADKLEWAKTILRNRLPTRFPEELVMDVDKKSAEVKYETDEKTSAYYSILVTYHFEDDHPKTFRWYPVTFFFEIRANAWTLTGDKWVRESELIFE